MNIKITTFTNPFSFFCVNEDYRKHNNYLTLESESDLGKNSTNTSKIGKINHGQHVAVMWNKNWARGVVSMENQVLIWLLDYGIFLRPNDKTIYVDLPIEYRKLPTKVFEASIHGVVPVDKVLTEDCQIRNFVTTTWTKGCIERCQEMIKNAATIFFQPIALLTTSHNHVVIGDLFLEIEEKGIVNIIDELESWPVFLERNKEAYVTNFMKLYTSRRKHRLCSLKPEIPDFDLAEITLQTTLEEYNEILEKCPKLENFLETDSLSGDDSTVVESVAPTKDKSAYKISPEDIEKYANKYVIINGCKYNVLSILINKARDLSICERYKDHDLKSVGRGYSYRNSFS
ncbi:uncharacterized protein LOC123669738 [Melitaea cinxia]|uniref:uncharacterized protein LOC123669738 n=1 Tax=Melitaea cinxia TaxID=113334 RepID=UPI001E2739E0|nr:uncharacterized protein LOC123669738 [Melitaea cinxia]